MKTAFSLFIAILFSFQNLLGQTSPDWTLTDVYGNEHTLYEDYLDQGKTVLISFGGAWNVWDSVWISSGVLQDFTIMYGGDGDAEVLFIDPTGSSIDALYGDVGAGGIGYDFISGNDFPIFTTGGTGAFDIDSFIVDAYNVLYFPTTRLICPDGTIYTEDSQGNNFLHEPDLNYGALMEGGASLLADLMTANCGTTFSGSRLEASVFRDRDGDCEYSGAQEEFLANIKAKITGPNGEFFRVSKDDGKFYSIMQEGDYEVELIPPNYLWEDCNGPAQYTFDNTDQLITDELALAAIQDCYSPTLSVSTARLRRCFDSEIFISYCNEGTEMAPNSYVVLQLEEELDFVDANYPYTIENNGILFELGDLNVWECGKIKVTVVPNCDNTALGDTLCFSATISPHVCNADSLFYDVECQEVIGAYDPNDKRAFPDLGAEKYTVKPNTNIRYQIRFQNTGTDTAFNIYIEDVISEKLDLSTLRPGTSSHNYDFEISDERKVRFLFNNIMLPDSNVDLAGSNGFITYYIDQIADLKNGEEINNTAAIYFDFNEPIITNTTVHEVDDGTVLSNNNLPIASEAFSIRPNPAISDFNLQIHEDIWLGAKLEIYDLIGRLKISTNISERSNKVNVSALQDGVYFVRISKQGSEYTRKLVIQE